MEEFKFEYRKWQYYIIIGVISLIAVFFLPMVGSEADLAWKLPNTFVGWVVYVVTKLLIAAINMMLFYCFMEQAKVNVKDNEKYIEANEILLKHLNKKELIPRGPEAWTKKQYGTKGVTIFATTIFSAVGLTQAILTFDWISMLTYIFTIIMGIIFGVIQMNNAELYWTEEYWKYAKMVEREMSLDQEKPTEQRDADICDNRGTDILEPSDNYSITSSIDKPMVVGYSWSDLCFLGRSTNPSNPITDSTDSRIEENLQ